MVSYKKQPKKGLTMEKIKLFIDMDEVLADFHRSEKHHDFTKTTTPSAMYVNNFFRDLLPVEHAIACVQELRKSNKFEIYILTQPLVEAPMSYFEKAAWIATYLPFLNYNLIMTQDKALVGDANSILIDDNQKWRTFPGEFIWFDTSKSPKEEWKRILSYLLCK